MPLLAGDTVVSPYTQLRTREFVNSGNKSVRTDITSEVELPIVATTLPTIAAASLTTVPEATPPVTAEATPLPRPAGPAKSVLDPGPVGEKPGGHDPLSPVPETRANTSGT